jgi:hypothetical protein
MSPEVFDQFFAVLQRSGDTARSTIYVFVLIYGAMLYYGANTYIYPINQHLLTTVQDQINKTDDCDKQPAGTPCLAVSDGQTVNSKFNYDFSAHVLDYWQDKAASDRAFQIPFVGVAPDRNWFWLVNIVLSLLFYVLIRGAFNNHLRLLEYLFRNNRDNPTRIMLLGTTQIITSTSGSRLPGVPRSKLHWSAEFLSSLVILLLPILVSCFILFDWIYLASTATRVTDVIYQPSLTTGFVLTIFALLWQAHMLRGIVTILHRLFQSDRDRRIAAAEATADDPL